MEERERERHLVRGQAGSRTTTTNADEPSRMSLPPPTKKATPVASSPPSSRVG